MKVKELISNILGEIKYLRRHFVNPKKWLRKTFKIRQGYDLNLNNPTTFNEKLQWLKLYYRNPDYIQMVDKYEAKKYVAERIGEQYIIPTYGIWDKFEDIDFNSLPDQFVLKCTHDSGGVVICKDKRKFDYSQARKKLNKSLRHNYYWYGFEWPYKFVKPRIIAEKYMVDESGYELKDYKTFNFNGVTKVIQVDFGRFSEHMRNLYTTDWNIIDGEIKYKSNPNRKIPKPECLDEMISVAQKLTAGYPFIRADFYCINEHLYFGELTIYHGNGMEEFRPESMGVEFGSWLELPQKIV